MQYKQYTETDRGSLGMAVTLLLLTVLVLMIFFIIANPTIIVDEIESVATL
jgi:biopolymer transport protein ExbD